MGRTKEMWMDEVESVGEDYAVGNINADEFRDRMKRLGFDPDEISDHLDALAEDRANVVTLD